MKKIRFRIILFLFVIVLTAFTLVGCNNTNGVIDVSTDLIINSDFSGQRIINLSFDEKTMLSSEQEDFLNDIILDECPEDLKSKYITTNNKVSYKIILDFSSKTDYKNKIEKITGNDHIVSYSKYDNVLTKGWCVYEDFDSLDLISWINDGILENKKINFNLLQNSNPSVILDGQASEKNFSDGKNIYAGTINGHAVNSIDISTTNYKDNTYDRKFIISVPEKTYVTLGQKLIDYIAVNGAYANSINWEKSGKNRECTVMYKGIDYVTMQNVTSSILGSTDSFIAYGDINKSSTPLADQSVYEEEISICGFINENGKSSKLNFSYTLPEDVERNDGIILKSGVWEKYGKWKDGKFSFETNFPVVKLKIPDGKQYTAKKIKFTISGGDTKNQNTNDTFTKTVSFFFDAEKNEKDFNYNRKWFTKLGFSPEVKINKKTLECKLTFEGTINEINKEIEKALGSGNNLLCEKKSSIMAVTYKINIKDNINIDYMLTGENENIPIEYHVQQASGENIRSFHSKNSGNKFEQKDGVICINLKGGNDKINYIGTRPYQNGIIFCSVIFILIISIFILLLFLMNKKKISEKMNIKLCVFDLDGTLVDSIEDLASAVNKSLEKRGLEQHSIDKYKIFVGDGVLKLIKRAAPLCDDDELEEIKEEFDAYYQRHCLDKTRPYEGCSEMLDELESRGIRYGILSNKPQEFIEKIVTELYPDKNFDFIFGKRNGYKPKPDPRALQEILEIYEVDPEECLYIGDSNVDIKTGKNAGTRTCGVLWGFRSKKELKNEKPDIIINTPKEIKLFINK